MQTIQIKIDDDNVDFFMELIKKLNIVKEVQVNKVVKKSVKKKVNNPICMPEGEPSLSDFKGFWHNNPKTLDQIRKKAWKMI
jgi:hypothetical protein